MLREEIRIPKGQSSLLLTREQIERLIEPLKDIEKRAVRTTDGKGNPLYVLDKISEVEWTRAYLATALELGCDVTYG